MARVTASEVLEIMNTQLTEDQLAPFIKSANLTVTSILGESTVLSEDQLTEIERWLAAHFASVLDPLPVREIIGEAEASYQGKFGMQLQSTTYGQTAMSLDITGSLANLGKTKAYLKNIRTEIPE